VLGDVHISGGLLAAVIAAGVSTAGLLSMAALGDWGRRNSPYFSAFAIGVLLVAVMFHLTPEALSYSLDAWLWILIGLGGMAVIGLTLRTFTDRRVNGANLAFGYASIIALGTHSLLDGVIYQTSFHDEAFTGWLATFGLLLHEFPEGVIAFFLLREAGMSNGRAGFWAFVAASLTTIVGALASAYFIDLVPKLPYAALLGGTAGALIYIMVFHLGPHAFLTPNRRGYMMASVGIVIGIAAMVLRHSMH